MPYEACALLAGHPGLNIVSHCYLVSNVDKSTTSYTVDPIEHLEAERDAESRGAEIVGVFHSHTHSEAYPSATDIRLATQADWHYVIASFRDLHPVSRSFFIRDGSVREEELRIDR